MINSRYVCDPIPGNQKHNILAGAISGNCQSRNVEEFCGIFEKVGEKRSVIQSFMNEFRRPLQSASKRSFLFSGKTGRG